MSDQPYVSYMHYFEVVGTLLMRPSSNVGFPPVECVVIETRASVVDDGTVMFHQLTTGHDHYRFRRWFSDWSETDDMLLSVVETGTPYQNGRLVRVAIPRVSYDEILRTGRTHGRSYVVGNSTVTRRHAQRASTMPHEMVQTPIAAVFIDGVWIEPEYETTLFSAQQFSGKIGQ